MGKIDFVKRIVNLQKQGIAKGICSICSANNLVLEAALEKALRDKSFILIESTCNQVNQYGGYSGMKPREFKNYVYNIAQNINFPTEKIILGGDHLGPNSWKNEDSKFAMMKANKLIEEYVLAGYTKIHIDTSMYLADDPDDRSKPLGSSVIAERGAILVLKAESIYHKLKIEKPEAEPPIYVIGTEVPIPGGASSNKDIIKITTPSDLDEAICKFQESFLKYDLQKVWERVIAVVVQPGVEFGNDYIKDYNREKVKNLCRSLSNYPSLVFEAHSTDYQKPPLLKQMVEDGFCILKVGPALTFAMREALFALEYIEKELLDIDEFRLSNLQKTLDIAMVQDSENWKNYYCGNEKEIKLARKYSFSDRIRYYWTLPEVKDSINRLIINLSYIEIPLTLISQFMPVQYEKIRDGLLENNPLSLIKDKIINVLDDYDNAINPME